MVQPFCLGAFLGRDMHTAVSAYVVSPSAPLLMRRKQLRLKEQVNRQQVSQSQDPSKSSHYKTEQLRTQIKSRARSTSAKPVTASYGKAAAMTPKTPAKKTESPSRDTSSEEKVSKSIRGTFLLAASA